MVMGEVELNVELMLTVTSAGLLPGEKPPSKRAWPVPVKAPAPETRPKKFAAPPAETRSSALFCTASRKLTCAPLETMILPPSLLLIAPATVDTPNVTLTCPALYRPPRNEAFA